MVRGSNGSRQVVVTAQHLQHPLRSIAFAPISPGVALHGGSAL
jgi:hypothetical protein